MSPARDPSRPSSGTPMPREPYRPVERTELLRPAAAPVDSFVRAQEPSRDTSLQDLARSLSGLGGSLAGLVGQRDKEAEEAGRGLQKAAGKTAANFVPFASGLRFANPDPLMRETRGIVDSIMATVSGLSERLPARRDLFGDPRTVHKGLWVTGKDGLVDAEVRRMIDEAQVGPFGAPSYQQRGVDLRDVTTADGRSAYEAFQELAGHRPRGPSLKERMGRLMATKAYQNAPDGGLGDHATKGPSRPCSRAPRRSTGRWA